MKPFKANVYKDTRHRGSVLVSLDRRKFFPFFILNVPVGATNEELLALTQRQIFDGLTGKIGDTYAAYSKGVVESENAKGEYIGKVTWER